MRGGGGGRSRSEPVSVTINWRCLWERRSLPIDCCHSTAFLSLKAARPCGGGVGITDIAQIERKTWLIAVRARFYRGWRADLSRPRAVFLNGNFAEVRHDGP